jgi:hypothetical protein
MEIPLILAFLVAVLFSRTLRAFPSPYYPRFASASYFLVLLVCRPALVCDLLYALLPFLVVRFSHVRPLPLSDCIAYWFYSATLEPLHTRALSSDASGWTCATPDIPSGSCCGRYRDSQLP